MPPIISVFGPIVEVAVLFFGIFATMMPMLDRLLNVGGRLYAGPGLLGGRDAFRFSGQRAGLSGVFQRHSGRPSGFRNGFAAAGAGAKIVALSVGTVVFGALTYIGNGPNLMVKSIADHQKARSPAFLGYLFKWAVPIMLPLLIILWLVFFR